MPRPGAYAFHIWLRDEAGNDAPSSAIEVPLRFDDVAPGVAFDAGPDAPGPDLPESVGAEVSDEHSGPAGGEIGYRRLNADRWVELPTKTEAGDGPGSAHLVAQLPDGLDPGTYVFRADAVDAAGNTASTTRRADGTEMALRKTPPPVAPSRPAEKAAPQAKTRLFAKLRWRHRHGPQVTVPFDAGAALSGRLLNAGGAGLAGRRLRVVSRPSRGALAPRRVETVRTGSHGGFRLACPLGPRAASRSATPASPGSPPPAAPPWHCGCAAPSPSTRRRAPCAPASRCACGAGSALGERRCRGAASWSRSSTTRPRRHRWRPVLVTRSDHSGRFRARYRFRYVSGIARIRLRAVALAEERWPYAPGASRPVTVQVSGPLG